MTDATSYERLDIGSVQGAEGNEYIKSRVEKPLLPKGNNDQELNPTIESFKEWRKNKMGCSNCRPRQKTTLVKSRCKNKNLSDSNSTWHRADKSGNLRETSTKIGQFKSDKKLKHNKNSDRRDLSSWDKRLSSVGGEIHERETSSIRRKRVNSISTMTDYSARITGRTEKSHNTSKNILKSPKESRDKTHERTKSKCDNPGINACFKLKLLWSLSKLSAGIS